MQKSLVIKARYGMDLSVHYDDISKFSGECYFEDNNIMIVGNERELGECIEVTRHRFGRSHVSVVNSDSEVFCTII